MAVQITHVRKPNRDSPHEAISHYGLALSGGLKVFEREWLINWLRDNNTYAFVSEDGTSAVCDVKSNGHVRYLQTRADASEANNLLSLPPC